jgi:hypothetical protein
MIQLRQPRRPRLQVCPAGLRLAASFQGAALVLECELKARQRSHRNKHFPQNPGYGFLMKFSGAGYQSLPQYAPNSFLASPAFVSSAKQG